MENFYIEFGMEIFDKSIIQSSISIMKKLGDIKIFETKRNTTIIDYCIHSKGEYDVEIISNQLCEKLGPFIDIVKSFLRSNSSKLYSDICFVKTTDSSDILIKINKNLINLAYELNVEINFDGF